MIVAVDEAEDELVAFDEYVVEEVKVLPTQACSQELVVPQAVPRCLGFPVQ